MGVSPFSLSDTHLYLLDFVIQFGCRTRPCYGFDTAGGVRLTPRSRFFFCNSPSILHFFESRKCISDEILSKWSGLFYLPLEHFIGLCGSATSYRTIKIEHAHTELSNK